MEVRGCNSPVPLGDDVVVEGVEEEEGVVELALVVMTFILVFEASDST